ncbi:Serine/threonine-protein kinase Nek2 [Entomortierella beljakovae]|nr:Serine/threonine-protein kinase Nek2 [Entomortierella beljakovae]
MEYDPRHMDEYDTLESIGSGSFGLIRKVRRKTDGKVLARKEIDYRKMTTKEKEQLVSEVNILKDLKHPNIVEFLERAIDRENSFIYILMEYCEGGDLASVIRRHKEKMWPIGEEFVWTIMTQLTMALHECHCGTTFDMETNQPIPRPPILHRDLKPENVFLDGNKNVKLGDFGLSRSLSNPQKAFAQTYVGTPYYMSPELIGESVYDIKSDIWSLGCVIFEMCTLEPPFLADSQAALFTKIKLGKIQTLPSQYSSELNTVVRSMLQLNSRKRPTTTDLLANPRIKIYKLYIENERRSEELGIREQVIAEWTEKYCENEAALIAYERKLRAEEQRLREMDTILVSKEEALRAKEATLAAKEADLIANISTLTEHEKRLSIERHHLEEKRRELSLENEKRQLASRKTLSNIHSSEPMAIDSGYLHDNSRNYNTNSSASVIGTSSAWKSSHQWPNGTMIAPDFGNRGSGASSSMDQTHAPRRKTGLSIGGRHSLQPSTAQRSSFALSSKGASNHHSSSETQDQGETNTSSRLANISNSSQRPSILGLFGNSSDSASSFTRSSQGQPGTYQSSNGKESRLTGKLGSVGLASPHSLTNDSQRLRGKTKSTSSLIAQMSSATLSGNGSEPSSSHASHLVPESSRTVTSTVPPVRGLSASVSGHDATTTSNRFHSIVSSTPLTTNDTQKLADSEASSQSASASNGYNYNRPASAMNGASSRVSGLHSQPSHFSTSSASSSPGIGNYTSRRSVAPPASQIRFNPSTTSASTASSTIPVTPFTFSVNTTSSTSNGGTSATASGTTVVNSNNNNNNNVTTQETPKTPPSSDDRFVRPTTPPRIPRSDDLRMEWDDEIPSPFIKKTYNRLSSGPGGSSLNRNLMGS